MKNIITLIFGIVVITSCSKSETIKGELYFKLVSFNSNHSFSSEQIKKIEEVLDTLNINNIKDKNNKVFYKEILKLKKHNLLESPFIFIKSNKAVRKIYLDQDSFEKVNKYTLDNLKKNKKKIKIELKTIKLESDIYKSNDIISIKEVSGETPWNK
jgi:hypothetical protein